MCNTNTVRRRRNPTAELRMLMNHPLETQLNESRLAPRAPGLEFPQSPNALPPRNVLPLQETERPRVTTALRAMMNIQTARLNG